MTRYTKRREVQGKFPARFDSRCAACGDTIEEGQETARVWDNLKRKADYVHADEDHECLEEFIG